jgi:alpha-tubulin suppressor-like RCC1 family protein
VALGVALLLSQAALWIGCDQLLGVEEATDAGATSDGSHPRESGGPDVDSGGDSGSIDTGIRLDANCAIPDAPPCEGGKCIVELTAGTDFACARRSDQSVWCWGSNQYGQLGHSPGSNGDELCSVDKQKAYCQPTPNRIPLEAGAVHVAAGGDFACASTSAGEILCWGFNEQDELGHPAGQGDMVCPTQAGADAAVAPCNPGPMPVQANEGGTLFDAGTSPPVSAGSRFACTLVGGHPYCWGYHGNEGLGALTSTTPYPIAVGLYNAEELSLSTAIDTACAILYGGQVWCWGANYGQVVAAADASCSGAGGCPPLQVVTADGGAFEPAATVRVGYQYACALGTDQSLWCWGSNGFDQLGEPVDGSTHAARTATYWDKAGVAAEQLALSEQTTLVLDKCGNVWGWGDNTFGEVGTANFSTMKPVAEPAPIAVGDGAGPVTQITGGFMFAVALTADDAVWGWGVNSYGQVGHEAGAAGDVTRGGMQRVCNNQPQRVVFPEE